MQTQASALQILPAGVASIESDTEAQYLSGIEHKAIELPRELLTANGQNGIYPSSLGYCALGFRGTTPIVQLGRWVGILPFAPGYYLKIETRVPVANLEMMMRRVSRFVPGTLEDSARTYAESDHISRPILEIIGNSLVAGCERLMLVGLLCQNDMRTGVGARPRGRIDPLASALHTARLARPTAAYTFFSRTRNTRANRIIRSALLNLKAQLNEAPLGDVRKLVTRVASLTDKMWESRKCLTLTWTLPFRFLLKYRRQNGSNICAPFQLRR